MSRDIADRLLESLRPTRHLLTRTLPNIPIGGPEYRQIDRVVQEIDGPVSRPVGFGDGTAIVHSTTLQPHDRVLFFTDGVVEERLPDGVQFGEQRLREFIEDNALHALPVAETVRLLSHELLGGRGGRTSDDASLLMVEWSGPPRDDELARDLIDAVPPGTVLG